MPQSRIFLDTSYIQALLNPKDQFHEEAKKYIKYLNKNLCLHDGILIELANALSKLDKQKAGAWIKSNWSPANKKVEVMSLDRKLIKRAFENFYEKRDDKDWGLMDCVSFQIMEEKKLFEVLSFDRDFQQAGFKVICLP